MGQRLNIEIRRRKDNKVLANCYYHWSAYTRTSLELADTILSNINEIVARKNDIRDEIKAVQLLQTTGAGLIEEEYNKISKEEQKYCAISQNRNMGLISITEDSMENTRTYEEDRLTIDIDFENKEFRFDNKTDYVEFGVYFGTNKEEIEEYYKNEDFDLDNIVEFDFDLYQMYQDDIYNFINKLENIENNCGLFKLKNNNQLYQIIY